MMGVGAVVVPLVALVGCAGKDQDTGVFSTGATATASGTDDDAGTSEDEGETGAKFDVMGGNEGNGDDGGGMGCEKADFLFIIDNSGSMEDEQQNLVQSFPGFISTIQDTLMAQDYHIMAVDTDAESLSFSGLNCVNNVCSCMPEPQCCFALCNGIGPIMINPLPTECGGMDCDLFKDLPEGCPVTLGAGKTNDPLDNPCNFASGKSYMTDNEPDLESAFTCAAKVGAGGDGNERPMEAMTESIGPLLDPGECNEGFLRNDAILVVTFITDEEDEGSMGDIASWKQALVDAKGGNEDAIVVLGLVGDPDVPNGVCNDQADAAPKLRSFAESFTNGQWSSVCAPDYSPFFLDAVDSIDFVCDNFVPPG